MSEGLEVLEGERGDIIFGEIQVCRTVSQLSGNRQIDCGGGC
jgi:hypothetical protein